MDSEAPCFRRIDKRRLIEKVTIPRIAWALQVTEEQVRKWQVLIPPLESQYIRESSGCSHQANRRVIRKTTAIALFDEGIYGLAAWLGVTIDHLAAPGLFLDEYPSLLIEYATKGAVKGISIKTLHATDNLSIH